MKICNTEIAISADEAGIKTLYPKFPPKNILPDKILDWQSSLGMAFCVLEVR